MSFGASLVLPQKEGKRPFFWWGQALGRGGEWRGICLFLPRSEYQVLESQGLAWQFVLFPLPLHWGLKGPCRAEGCQLRALPFKESKLLFFWGHPFSNLFLLPGILTTIWTTIIWTCLKVYKCFIRHPIHKRETQRATLASGDIVSSGNSGPHFLYYLKSNGAKSCLVTASLFLLCLSPHDLWCLTGVQT